MASQGVTTVQPRTHTEGVPITRVQHPETKKWDSTATILSRILKRTYQIQMEDGKITHRNRRWLRKWHLSDCTKPPNLKADDDGEFFGWDDDGKEITDQNGIDPVSYTHLTLPTKA